MIDIAALPKVAFGEMNEVHAEEIELINTLESLLSDNDVAGIETQLDRIFQHTVDHFQNEQRLMQEVGFPAYMMHKTEHDRVLNEMQFTVMDWRTRKDNAILQIYFFQTIPAWLSQHIASMDTITAQFICMHKGC
jgi:hemerythrin